MLKIFILSIIVLFMIIITYLYHRYTSWYDLVGAKQTKLNHVVVKKNTKGYQRSLEVCFLCLGICVITPNSLLGMHNKSQNPMSLGANDDRSAFRGDMVGYSGNGALVTTACEKQSSQYAVEEPNLDDAIMNNKKVDSTKASNQLEDIKAYMLMDITYIKEMNVELVKVNSKNITNETLIGFIVNNSFTQIDSKIEEPDYACKIITKNDETIDLLLKNNNNELYEICLVASDECYRVSESGE